MTASGTGDSPKSWSVRVKPGPAWIAVNCSGDGRLQVAAAPAATLGIVCDSSSVTPSFNEIVVETARTWTVTTKGPSSVRWALNVSQ